MNRNQLRYFVSAAEHRSFTKAAEQYYISQTAVTQQIQQLEQTLGCELFDRSTRPVSLTSAGKSFLLDAKAILERMSRAQERVHLRPLLQHRHSIGTLPPHSSGKTHPNASLPKHEEKWWGCSLPDSRWDRNTSVDSSLSEWSYESAQRSIHL